ncbi:MAG: HAD family hydrolase, partial [Oscillospiraceae bacterium]|nr:HAD family hydrolase [Oscillospiraceae bacterium]
MAGTCFFDLYGTLVDIWTDEGKPSLWRGTAEFYSLCGAPYTAAELKERYLALCTEETAALAAARPDLGEEGVEIELRNIFRRLYEEKGAAAGEERVADTAVLFRALSFRRAPRLMPGARRTLKELRRRGTRLFLLSNAQSCFTVPELKRLGIAEAFDGIFLSSDFGCRRPAPAFFLAALSRALDCKVVAISALKGTGVTEAAEEAVALARSGIKPIPQHRFAGSVEHALA